MLIRAFVAIDLPEPHRDALERLQEHLPLGRPVPPENFHLTLAFLDAQPEPALEALHHELERLRAPGVAVEIAGLGSFGASPRVIFADVAAQTPLRQLRDRVRGAAHAAGIALPRERFRPHVTLARLPERLPQEGLERLRLWLERTGGFRLPPYAVREITLYRSQLTRSGAIHEAMADYPLG